jgi:FtsH-binding integral membrane protein
MARLMTGGYAWLIVLGAFMMVSFIADGWARSTTSPQTQYLGLALYVVAEAIIFLPLLLMAYMIAPSVIPTAAIITVALFGGLTFTAITTKKDFSFLGGILKMGFFVAMGLIVASILFGFSLGLFFSGAMIVFAAGAILYSTSNILHQYRPEQHVAAALSLFAAVALLFWYVVRFLSHFARR